jgi:endonuclease YncB( thermonuclease family)
LPPPLKKELSIRVYGVDTPEKSFRAKCPSEAQRGEAATAFTKELINKSTKRQIILMDWDKYGGRVLGDILLDDKSLRQQLIANGYAREYFGEAKTSWCN